LQAGPKSFVNVTSTLQQGSRSSNQQQRCGGAKIADLQIQLPAG